MLNNYTFLTDHSYSLRPVVDDNDEIPLKKREEKNKKRRQSSNNIHKTSSTTNRTASIDRNSSDKENNISTSITNPTGSYRSRLSSRIAMTNSGKKQTSLKTTIKSTSRNITKKKKVVNRGKTKLLNISHIDSTDASPSLSIEERVKLRRTKPLQPSTSLLEKKMTKTKKSQKQSTPKTQQQIRQSRTKKPTKSFLGSGLDLDNIVLGNRQRRCVQT